VNSNAQSVGASLSMLQSGLGYRDLLSSVQITTSDFSASVPSKSQSIHHQSFNVELQSKFSRIEEAGQLTLDSRAEETA